MDGAPVYRVNISANASRALTSEEKTYMQSLKQSIIGSSIPEKYYDSWENSRNSKDNDIYKDLYTDYIMYKPEFIQWQKNLKKYLQLRFREIENEIYHPKLKPTDFLTWGIERGKQGVTDFKTKMQQASDILFEIVCEDERNR